MPRSGLTRAAVVDAAAALADEIGFEQLTLLALARRLDVRSPSLFNHVEGLAGLRRELQLKGLAEMTDLVSRATSGLAGGEAVIAAAGAIRDFARRRPGLYAAALPSAPPGDPELAAAGEEFVGTFFTAMRGYGLEGDDAVHAVRGLFSTVHGFVMLELAGTFGLPIGVDESFHRLVRRYVESLEG